MKKFIVGGLLLIVIIIAAGLSYLKLGLPNVGAPEDIKITATPEMIARGKYLANHVAVCIDCHSTRDWSRFSGPPLSGTEGKGGDIFSRDFGFPGNFYAKNITPAGIGHWTDGELLRVISTGVNKDGKAIFPVMPYHNYGRMAKEDLLAIIAYIRTLPSIANQVPDAEIDFPMSFIINTIPAKADFQPLPLKEKTIDYGAYLVNAAGCIECHTNVEKGKRIPGMDFAGGRNFDMPGKRIVSSNITPDKETGIGYWTEEAFIAKFKSFADTSKLQQYNDSEDYQSIMPWSMYAGMDSSDLSAMYAYLKTLKPISNKVVANPN